MYRHKGPNFLGIGASRCGTSWLWSRLKLSSELNLPPRKEIHYFDRSTKYPTSSWLAEDSIVNRLFECSKHNSRLRRLAVRGIGGSALDLNWSRLKWYIKYCFGDYNDEWYLSLFKNNKITGEITPGYCVLDRSDVRKVRKVCPNAKVIYIIRDPIERAWSHVRFAWTRERIRNIEDTEAVKSFVDSPAQSLQSMYMKNYKKWSDIYGNENVFVGFYDQISKNPNVFLKEVSNFINITSEELLVSQNIKINKSRRKQIPTTIKRYLVDKYEKCIISTADMFGSFAMEWVKKYKLK